MTTKNLIKKENRFEREYIATVISNEDPLLRGRLLVTIDSLMGKTPFWVNCTNVAGKVRFQLIPEPDDIVSVKFRNKDIYSGEWELKGSPNNSSEIDPKKYGLSDDQGNFIIIDRTTNNISINAENDYNLTVKKVANITILSNANVSIEGNATTTIKGNANITANGNTNLKTTTCNVDASTTNLGVGGNAIARVGDSVSVTVTRGDSAGTYSGTITSGGTNTSI